ncbi:hypothetical protein C8Q76DRAFT_792830 [Earliella scabrosa]|nr:hypothetical protein C8Q76DRAFT_792830 [Earliella scabrosa]
MAEQTITITRHVDLPALDYVFVRHPGSMDAAHVEEALSTAVGESSAASPRSIGDILDQPAALPRLYYHALNSNLLCHGSQLPSRIPPVEQGHRFTVVLYPFPIPLPEQSVLPIDHYRALPRALLDGLSDQQTDSEHSPPADEAAGSEPHA